MLAARACSCPAMLARSAAWARDRSLIKKADEYNTAEDLQAALDKAEPELKRRFLAAMRWLRDQRTVDQLATLVVAGRTQEALAEIDRAAQRFAAAVNEVFANTAKSISKGLSTFLDDPLIHYDPGNPVAAGAARDKAAELVRAIGEEQRLLLRKIVADAAAAGEHPYQTAKTIRAAIGLTPAQYDYVASYRRSLEKGSVDALSRELRDRRFDPSVRRAAAGEQPLTADQIDRAVERYASRMLDLRARTIARTEAITAIHEGQEEILRQLMAKGEISSSQMEAVWYATHDNATRAWHWTMDGQVRPIGQPFVSGQGNRLRYPGDRNAPASERINCRCAKAVRIRRSKPTFGPYG